MHEKIQAGYRTGYGTYGYMYINCSMKTNLRTFICKVTAALKLHEMFTKKLFTDIIKIFIKNSNIPR